MAQPSRSGAVIALLAPPALALLAPTTTGPEAPLLELVSATAWACTGWLLLVLVLTAGARVPGVVGRATGRALRWSAPPGVRSLVGAAVGASLVLTAPAALAEDRTPTVAGSAADSLDWPGLAPVTARPDAARPETPPAPTTTVRPTAQHRPTAVPAVVVAPGDSLWSLAAEHLGPAATAAQVAHEWPQWWAANRAVVGDDPDLIHPGDRLSAP